MQYTYFLKALVKYNLEYMVDFLSGSKSVEDFIRLHSFMSYTFPGDSDSRHGFLLEKNVKQSYYPYFNLNGDFISCVVNPQPLTKGEFEYIKNRPDRSTGPKGDYQINDFYEFLSEILELNSIRNHIS